MFFKKNIEDEDDHNGLYVTVNDLIEQRKFLPYIRRYQNKVTSDQVGDIRSAFKGRGMEFEEVRAYGYGDDVRDIDWRVTARKGNTYTKVFAEEKDREVYVFLDLSSYMMFGTKKELKSVSAAKLAALLGWKSLENKDRFGLILGNDNEIRVFKPQSSQKNLMTIFKAIAEMSKEMFEDDKNKKIIPQKNVISEPLNSLQFNIKGHAMVFILSDFKYINNKKLLISLAKRCRLYCINIYDYIEDMPPPSAEYLVEYNGKKLVFDTSSEIFKRTYFYYFRDKRKELEDFCKKFKCYYIGIRTDKPLYKQLKIL